MRGATLVGVGVALGLLVASCARPLDDAGRPRALRGDITLVPDTFTFEARVPQNATLKTLLRSHDLPDDLISAMIDSARGVFDPRHLRAENPYRLVRTIDGLLRRFEYHIDGDRFLRILGREGPDETHGASMAVVGHSMTDGAQTFESASPPTPALQAELVPYEKRRMPAAARGTIDRDHASLVAALTAAGEGITLAMALADVFAGEIDFSNDLQPGDTFDVVFERVYREGEFAGYGAIEAAEFVNDGRRLRAFRFDVPGRGDGYYDAQGRSLKRFFLKSPLRFDPIVTSGFSSRRLHPVLGSSRAHFGVDYRAPYGAPVIAVAGGVVTAAGDSGEAGRIVSLRHPNGYETSYLHLSSIAKGIHAGARIAQGALIGRVGATGLATAPHLDYRLKKDGVFVNPVAEHRKMPPGEPIPAEYLAAFHSVRTRALTHLALRASDPTTPAADR